MSRGDSLRSFTVERDAVRMRYLLCSPALICTSISIVLQRCYNSYMYYFPTTTFNRTSNVQLPSPGELITILIVCVICSIDCFIKESLYIGYRFRPNDLSPE